MARKQASPHCPRFCTALRRFAPSTGLPCFLRLSTKARKLRSEVKASVSRAGSPSSQWSTQISGVQRLRKTHSAQVRPSVCARTPVQTTAGGAERAPPAAFRATRAAVRRRTPQTSPGSSPRRSPGPDPPRRSVLLRRRTRSNPRGSNGSHGGPGPGGRSRAGAAGRRTSGCFQRCQSPGSTPPSRPDFQDLADVSSSS